jgi:hypothetical protein
MTNSENKFRLWAKKQYPNSFIKKIPDFKQVGISGVVGLPDYLIIYKGDHYWYEVKSVKSKYLKLTDFTKGQLQTFPKMIKAGINIFIYVFYLKDFYIINFNDLIKNKRLRLEK